MNLRGRFDRALHFEIVVTTSNENKISDGYRERASIEVEMF